MNRARGFTLVEIIVALAAGLFVSAAAFLLARNATRFFQHEARISSAQLSAMLGMERLLADLDRAAYESTPNLSTSSRKCPRVTGSLPGVPAGLAQLAGVTIEEGGSSKVPGNPLTQSNANGMSPDRITIGGSFDTTEVFSVSGITAGGAGGWTVSLQKQSHEMLRALAAGQDLAEIFRPGRILRLVDPASRTELYGVIAGFDPGAASIQVGASPLMPSNSAQRTCGIPGFGVGMTANAISRVRYDIRSLTGHARYGTLVAPISASLSGDDGRTELVRVELDEDDNELPDTLELIAEYAVDLKFGISFTTVGAPLPDGAATCSSDPTGSYHHCPIPMSPDIYASVAGPITGGARPDLIRSVRIRLATRARAPDRDTDLGAGTDGRKYRFRIDLPGVPAPAFARMRTIYAEKHLRNQGAP